MYKDVGKRILAVMLCICMLVGMGYVSNLTVKAEVNLNTASVILDPATATYDGQEHVPGVTVKVGDATLTEGVDYDLSWAPTTLKNRGTYTLTVTPADGSTYTGSTSRNDYIIIPRNLFNAVDTETAEIEFQDITAGTVITQASDLLTIVDHGVAGEPTLVGMEESLYNTSPDPTVDYTYRITGTTAEVGTVTVTIIGRNNYNNYSSNMTYQVPVRGKSFGSVTYTKQLSYPIAGTNTNFISLYVTPQGNADPLVEGTDYEVTYYNSQGQVIRKSDIGEAGSYSFMITGINAYKGTNSEQLEFFINKDLSTYQATGEVVITFTDSVPYTGEPIVPDIRVTDNGRILVKDTDYKVIYGENNVNSGNRNGTFIVSGMGAYTGELYGSFSITPIALTDTSISVTMDSSCAYNGLEQQPIQEILFQGEDILSKCQIEYTNNVNVGMATAVITPNPGELNFTGSRTVNFDITRKSIQDESTISITMAATNYTYDGTVFKPEITIMDGATLLQENTDYRVYSNDTSKAGVYAVIIEGMGNYTDSVERSYNINAASLASETAKIEIIGEYTYTGRQITPALKVTYGNDPETAVELVYGRDYTIVRPETGTNLDAGNAAVTIQGQGNYKDQKTATFVIQRRSIGTDIGGAASGFNAWLSSTSLPYNGEAQTPTVNIIYDGIRLNYNSEDLLNSDYRITNAGAYTHTGSGVVRVTGTGNYTGSLELPFTITSRELTEEILKVTAMKSGERIAIEDLELPYIGGGREVEPENVELECELENDKVVSLFLGTDYTISYADNTGIGTAKMIIEGAGDYTGTVEKTFPIKGNIADAEITVNGSKVFNGQVIELDEDDITVTYQYNNETPAVLVYEEDYTFEYDNTADYSTVGTGKPVTVKAIGDYTGETRITFNIVKKNLQNPDGLEITIPDQVYTGSDVSLTTLKEQMDVSYRGMDLDKNLDYDISFTSASANHTNCTAEEGVSLTITAKAGSASYAGSTTRSFQIVPRELTQEDYEAGAITAVIRSGQPLVLVEQERISLTDSDLALAYSKDGIAFTDDTMEYEVVVPEDGYTQVGEAAVTIQGTGNFTGTVEVPFTIYGDLAAGLDEPYDEDGNVTRVEYDDRPGYAEGEVHPEPVVYYRGQALTLDTHYSVTYTGNCTTVTESLPVGQEAPKLQITGIGDYLSADVIERAYEIQKCDLAEAFASGAITIAGLDATKIVYDKEPQFPVTGLLNNGTPVTPEFTGSTTAEFEISYENNVQGANPESENPPTVVIQATEDNPNYTGELTAYFTITGRDFKEYDVDISNIADYIYIGRPFAPSVNVTVTSRDDAQEVLNLTKDEDYTVTYLNNLDAAAANSEAPPTVVITGINNFSGTIERTFTIYPKELSSQSEDYIVTIDDEVYTGEQIVPDVEIIDTARTPVTTVDGRSYSLRTLLTREVQGVVLQENQDYTLQPTVGVDNVNAGQKNGAVTIIGNGNYMGIIDSEEFDIQPRAMSDDSITVSQIETQSYQSAEIKPHPQVKLGDKVLADGIDYVLDYSNNIEAGTAVIEITSRNANLLGSRQTTFEISAKPLTDAEIVIADVAPQVYQEGGAEPKPMVIYNNVAAGQSITLTEGTDYTLTYANNEMTGENIATVSVTGAGNYTGTVNKTFTIVDNIALAEAEEISMQDYTGSPIEIKPVLTKDGATLTEGVDYTLSYTDNVEAGVATIVATGMGSFGGTKEITFEIGRDFTDLVEAVGFAESYVFTGTEITPLPGKVTAGEVVLKNGEDYSLSYTNNTNVGTATVTINGIGCYTGSKEYTFRIIHRSIAQCSVDSIGALTYTGQKQTPAITVRYGDVTLVNGTDYTVTYINNERPGTARVIINGRGNYVGSKVMNFRINLGTVAGVTGTGNSTKKVTISWNSTNNVTGYELYDAGNRRIARISGTRYSISGLQAATSYTYKVRAYVIKGGQTYYSSFTNVTVSTK